MSTNEWRVAIHHTLILPGRMRFVGALFLSVFPKKDIDERIFLRDECFKQPLPVMKIIAPILIAVTLVASFSETVEAQLIEYKFNTSDGASSVQSNANSGSLGSAWDGSFVSTAAASNTPLPPVNGSESWTGRNPNQFLSQTHGFYSPATDQTGLDNLAAFSLSMWVNMSGSQGTTGRMISYTNGGAGAKGFDIFGTPTAGFTLNVGGTNASGLSGTFAVNTWVFFAVTFDGSSGSNNVNFYTGDGTTLSSAGTRTLAVSNSGDPGAVRLAVFNYSLAGTTNRNSQGYYDDVRIYGSVQTLSELDAIMKINDVAVIPEPRPWLLVGIGLTFVLWRKRRRLV